VAIPIISGAKSIREKEEGQNSTLLLTLFGSLPLAIFVYFFAGFIVNTLFGGLNAYQKSVAINLIKMLWANVIFLSVLQSTNAILIGKGRAYFPLISMGIGVAIKTLLNFILLYNQRLNIYACGIASITCYFIAVLINLIMIISGRVKYAVKKPNGGQLTN
jgi:stage V sporulation protein B